MEIWELDASAQSAAVRAKSISAAEVTEAHLRRIDGVNPKLNAIVRRMDHDARSLAASLDARGTGGGSTTLTGVAMTSKVNTDHAGYPTDNGIAAYRDNIASSTLPALLGLHQAGGIFVGRTNTPAMSLRFDTENALHGQTFNPFGQHLSPGGSSGGAAVAVATGMCAVAQGNDVGGSIRWPAFCNGIVGLRPTMGRLNTMSTDPATPRPVTGQLMATNGPLARTVEDCRLAFEAMICVPTIDPWYSFAPSSLPAVPRSATLVIDDGLPMHDATRVAVTTAGRHLEAAGWTVEVVNPPMLNTIFTLWNRIAMGDLRRTVIPALPALGDAGLQSSMEAWVALFPDLGPDDLAPALVDRDVLLRRWAAFLADHPVMVMPTFTYPWMERGEDTRGVDCMRTLQERGRYLLGIPPLGLPALALPIGTHERVPQGVQLVAARFREDVLFSAARDIEEREGVRTVTDPVW